jgi:hypothetical protein
MSIACTSVPLNCHLCGSVLVKVVEPGTEDRAICPICWAAGAYHDVAADISALRRGSRIAPNIRRLVDQARFNRVAHKPADDE